MLETSKRTHSKLTNQLDLKRYRLYLLGLIFTTYSSKIASKNFIIHFQDRKCCGCNCKCCGLLCWMKIFIPLILVVAITLLAIYIPPLLNLSKTMLPGLARTHPQSKLYILCSLDTI